MYLRVYVLLINFNLFHFKRFAMFVGRGSPRFWPINGGGGGVCYTVTGRHVVAVKN